jgi:hypothetical protein
MPGSQGGRCKIACRKSDTYAINDRDCLLWLEGNISEGLANSIHIIESNIVRQQEVQVLTHGLAIALSQLMCRLQARFRYCLAGSECLHKPAPVSVLTELPAMSRCCSFCQIKNQDRDTLQSSHIITMHLSTQHTNTPHGRTCSTLAYCRAR